MQAQPLRSRRNIKITKIAGVSSIILQVLAIIIFVNNEGSVAFLAFLIVPVLMLAVLGQLLSIRYVEYTDQNLIVWDGNEQVHVPIDQIKSSTRGAWGTYLLKLSGSSGHIPKEIRVLGKPNRILKFTGRS